jgi:probable DNA metabolism protein
MRVDLPSPIDVGDFRSRANAFLAQQVPPADIDWHSGPSASSGSRFHGKGIVAALRPSALHSIVPRSFVRLTELVVLHRDEGRFELMYRLLWRLVHEPELAGAHGDRDMALAQSMAQAVRRDILKVRKNLRMRPLEPVDSVPLAFGWCEPQHRVTELVADGLSRTQPAPPWLLASPDRCVLWTGRHLICGPGLSAVKAHARSDVQWHELAAELARSPAVVPEAPATAE